ncbi:hypothetical protein GM418_08370 [Maribellus comscasis]|uniref:Alpha-galactosidase n=1 Tax=Maribellus comscasis TaxID=2681766 RepID=A0A6I6JRI4_9BACT|nr:hypothetical protein [Maribellus comscasis]QGY43670.1 hypothetical protein GM418_08370 [Maribellus comscasis]
MNKRNILLFFIAILLFSCSEEKTKFDVYLDGAEVKISGNKITASTGLATRQWKFTDLGLTTTSFSTKDAEFVNQDSNDCDWKFNWMPADEKAELINVNVKVDNDEGFNDDFIRTTVEFYYPVSKLGLLFDIWTLPGAPGFRTRISLKKLDPSDRPGEFTNGTIEQINFDTSLTKAKAIGYYNDTQHRNTAETPILKEEDLNIGTTDIVDWANVIMLSNGENWLSFVKESHKCVNRQGVNTGGFKLQAGKLEVTGTGLDSLHLTTDYQPCWATWSIVNKGNSTDAKLAIKQFDRKRYIIDPERDVYIMSNTWGSSSSGANSRYASREENILKELKVSNELGLDILQIDDGWQGIQYNKWEPVKTAIYKISDSDAVLPENTEYEVYPEGWENVREAAKDAGIKLGLWAAWTIPYEDLVQNYEMGNFKSFKLDFAKLNDYKTLSDFESRVRNFVLATDHKVRVNWDVTENAPRIGYYFGREYGNIYLENRKPVFPPNVVYQPWLVLRDAWHVAKYTNLNKFQVTYQNIDMIPHELSDAYKYTHDYTLAITLMGSPIFFQEIHLLTDEAKSALKPLLETYKNVRDEMYQGYVFAIGDEPSNASWTGFQNYQPETQTGYLTLFREINCPNSSYNFHLNFMEGKNVQFKDLITGREFDITDFKSLPAEMEQGAYKFLSYQVVN